MPGSSVWLLPPSSHPLNSILSSLIQQTSSRFHSTHHFIPHITLTSEISPSTYSHNPQAWLDELHLPPGSDVEVKFENLASEDVFVRKLYIKCQKLDGLKKLAVACRRQVEGFGDEEQAVGWVEEKYAPHLSLLYHDCPPIDAKRFSDMVRLAQKHDVDLAGRGELGGWSGGRLVIVPTQEPIDQWGPLAERQL
jgi:2',3'-cyclic-nucleotide 3'-phosphodiesterase